MPLAALTKIERRVGPEFTMHYNLYNCAQIIAAPSPGHSAPEAMNALEECLRRDVMPSGMGYDYMGMSYQVQLAEKGVSPGVIFGLSILFVFLVLAGLYESWSLPFSVLLSTPIAVCGALAFYCTYGVFEQSLHSKPTFTHRSDS